MPTEQQVLAIDRVADRRPGEVAEKRCFRCGKTKSRDEFARNRAKPGGLSGECRRCLRVDRHEHYHERGGEAIQAAYRARPEVKARIRDYDRERKRREDVRRRHNELTRVRLATPRGKVIKSRSNARERLKHATTDGRQAELLALIAMCDREIARLDARKAAEREAELPAEPDAGPGRKYGKSPARGIYCTPAGTFEVKVSVGKSKSVRGGTYATLDEARDAANALAFRLLGIRGYAVPREERKRA